MLLVFYGCSTVASTKTLRLRGEEDNEKVRHSNVFSVSYLYCFIVVITAISNDQMLMLSSLVPSPALVDSIPSMKELLLKKVLLTIPNTIVA